MPTEVTSKRAAVARAACGPLGARVTSALRAQCLCAVCRGRRAGGRGRGRGPPAGICVEISAT
jgi:hypothetical protein